MSGWQLAVFLFGAAGQAVGIGWLMYELGRLPSPHHLHEQQSNKPEAGEEG